MGGGLFTGDWGRGAFSRDIGGWGLSLEESADREKHLLKTLFNSEIGKNPDGGLGKVIRGINPFSSSLNDVEKMAVKGGQKPRARGVTSPAHITEERFRISKKLSESQSKNNDPRTK